MRRFRFGVAASCGSAVLFLALSLSAANPLTPLPLTRVRLYETGVGYFERSGVMQPGQTTLPVPTGHLDDALKTLVVLGGDLKVDGVAFSSSVSRELARRMAGVSGEPDEPLGFPQLLRSLKGEAVKITAPGGTWSGRIVEVLDPGQEELERCDPHGSRGVSERGSAQKDAASTRGDAALTTCSLVQRGSLVLLTPTGELKRVPSPDIASIQPVNAAARARLETALGALSQRNAQTRRDVSIKSENGGKITLGYVAETPVWRATYRLVLSAAKPRLQGWALLHNDTDEEWRRVKVDLVNGRPTSFLYPLAAPRYTSRELVTPEEELSSVPQLLDTTVDDQWTGNGGIGLSAIGEGGGGRGEGIGLHSIGTSGHGVGQGLNVESDELSVGNLAALAPAAGTEAAALFRYSLPQSLSLSAHSSALVPFADTTLQVKQVSWFASDAEAGASALHVTNDTQQTLPAGTLSVFQDGGFAGETLLPRSKPKQSHLLGYGVELDVELERDHGHATEEPRLFVWRGGALEQHYLRRRTEKLHLKNRSRSARTVYVELDVVDNGKVDSVGAKVGLGRDADTGKNYVSIELAAGTELTQALAIEEGLQRSSPFADLTAQSLRELAAAKLVSQKQRATLLSAAAQLAQAEARRAELPLRTRDVEQAVADVARVRENARVLGVADSDQAETMAKRVVALEGKITELRRRIDQLGADSGAFVAAAKRELAKL